MIDACRRRDRPRPRPCRPSARRHRPDRPQRRVRCGARCDQRRQRTFPPGPLRAESRARRHARARCPGEFVKINLAIARGLDYYTGTVYETFLTDPPARLRSAPVAATRTSRATTRRASCPASASRSARRACSRSCSKLGVIKSDVKTTAHALVSQRRAGARDGVPRDCQRAARRWAQHRGPYGGDDKLGKQMKYADRAGIRFAVLMGTDEQARGTVTLKDLTQGRTARRTQGGTGGAGTRVAVKLKSRGGNAGSPAFAAPTSRPSNRHAQTVEILADVGDLQLSLAGYACMKSRMYGSDSLGHGRDPVSGSRCSPD